MADPFLATLLLLGGAGWSLLIVLAMAHHPTGGTDFAMPAFLAGAAAFVLGALWWVWIIVGWVVV